MWAIHCSAEVFRLHICCQIHIRSTREFGEIICAIESFKADLLADPEFFEKVILKQRAYSDARFESSARVIRHRRRSIFVASVLVQRAHRDMPCWHRPRCPCC